MCYWPCGPSLLMTKMYMRWGFVNGNFQLSSVLNVHYVMLIDIADLTWLLHVYVPEPGMSEIPCQFPNCTFKAEHASEVVALDMFNSHVVSHQQPAAAALPPAKQKIPPIPRPEITQDINNKDWATFSTEWNRFKACTDIPADCLADQLFQYCEHGLGKLLLRSLLPEKDPSYRPSRRWLWSRLQPVPTVLICWLFDKIMGNRSGSFMWMYELLPPHVTLW